MRLFTEKNSRKVGKVRKYKTNKQTPPPPNPFEGFREKNKTSIIPGPRFGREAIQRCEPLGMAFPWGGGGSSKFRKVDERLVDWEVQNWPQIYRIRATTVGALSLLMRDPSNFLAELQVEIPKCYPLGVMVIHGNPYQGQEISLESSQSMTGLN